MEITPRGSHSSVMAARPVHSDCARLAGSDRLDRSSQSGSNLSLDEHNGVQIELMKRMGADRDPAQMLLWIENHASRFRDLIESPEAEGWRGELRNPESRSGALAWLHQQLLNPPAEA